MARSLVRRWLAHKAEIDELEREIEALVRRTAPAMLEPPGRAAVTAAQLVVTADANPERMRSEAAFAALCGISAVQASSGQTSRHNRKEFMRCLKRYIAANSTGSSWTR